MAAAVVTMGSARYPVVFEVMSEEGKQIHVLLNSMMNRHLL